MSQQQSSLQQFIAKQHENTEVAFINGQSTLRDSDYRNEIYRQLVSHPLSPNVPLDKQLIQQLAKETGPILLCICAAQHISKNLLNELWSLVLKNKDLEKGHHLNVLLFGSPEWTESAKSNLAKDNQHLPILLSSEVISKNQFTQSYSESINQKRAEIAQRFKNNGDGETDSTINKPLFKILAGIAFLGIFSMLVFWQYPDEIKQFVNADYTNMDETGREIEELEKAALTESTKVSPIQEEDLAEQNNLTEEHLEKANQLIESTATEEEANILSADESQELVTTWQQEIEKQELQTQKELQEKPLDKPNQPDSVSVNEDLNSDDKQVDHPIAELNDQLFVLQLASMSDLDVATRFVQEHDLQDTSWLYTTQRFGGDWHVVIFKKTFANVQQARQYTASLPDSIDKTVPFAKSVKQIKVELAVPQQ
ncbi:hypothetical protein [Aliiglaciecola aliphaticivorans]